MNGKTWFKCLGVGLLLAASVSGCGGGEEAVEATNPAPEGGNTAVSGNAATLPPGASELPPGDLPKDKQSPP